VIYSQWWPAVLTEQLSGAVLVHTDNLMCWQWLHDWQVNQPVPRDHSVPLRAALTTNHTARHWYVAMWPQCAATCRADNKPHSTALIRSHVTTVCHYVQSRQQTTPHGTDKPHSTALIRRHVTTVCRYMQHWQQTTLHVTNKPHSMALIHSYHITVQGRQRCNVYSQITTEI